MILNVLVPKSCPTSSSALACFGQDETKLLALYFDKFLEAEVTMTEEFPTFKRLVFDNYSSLTFVQMSEVVCSRLNDL